MMSMLSIRLFLVLSISLSSGESCFSKYTKGQMLNAFQNTQKNPRQGYNPTMLLKQQRVLSEGTDTATSADGLSSLGTSEIMFCKTVGLCASFYLCCLWGLCAYYKTAIKTGNLTPSVPCREA